MSGDIMDQATVSQSDMTHGVSMWLVPGAEDCLRQAPNWSKKIACSIHRAVVERSRRIR